MCRCAGDDACRMTRRGRHVATTEAALATAHKVLLVEDSPDIRSLVVDRILEGAFNDGQG